jgi:hypothetical protein
MFFFFDNDTNIFFNLIHLSLIKEDISIIIKEKEHGIKEITLLNKLNNSFYKFLHNPYSKNFEKSTYKTESIEELYVFLENKLKLFKEWNINYAECYVSAYNVEEQKVFNILGFQARGYVPSWDYNCRENVFEDRIVFNYFVGDIDENMRLIPEVEDLINILNEEKDQDFQVI